MGLLDFIFNKKEQEKTEKIAMTQFKMLTAYQPRFTSWDGALYESERVRSAIDARARHCSKLSIELKGTAQPSLRSKLKRRPNDFQTWSQFLYRTSTILDMQNTAFIVPVYDRFMELSGYYSVLPSQCEILESENALYLRYKFASGQKACVEFDRCGILTKFQYKNDMFGEHNNALDDTMKLINLQNQGIEEAIKNGASYRFAAQVNNFSKADDLKKERKRFNEENFSKDAQGGGLLLFPNTYQNIQQINANSYTIDNEQMALIDKNISNYYGVNEDILQNKAYGDSWSAFYEGCVEVFAIQLSEVLTKMTFTDREQAQGSEVLALANRLQYMSNKEKEAFTEKMLDRGVITVNEARVMWNLEPVDGGDVRVIRGEYYNADEKVQDAEDISEEDSDET